MKFTKVFLNKPIFYMTPRIPKLQHKNNVLCTKYNCWESFPFVSNFIKWV